MKLLAILIMLTIIFAAFLFVSSSILNGDNEITSSATKHSYEDNSLQPNYGDSSGMVLVTITGLD